MPGLPPEPSEEKLKDEPRVVEIGLMGSPLVGYTVYRILSEGKVASASKPGPSVSARVSDSSFSRWAHSRSGCVASSKFSCPGLRGINQESPIGADAGPAHRRELISGQ